MPSTATYEHPVIGLVAPAALLVADQVTFTINDVANADVALIVTHNMGLSAAELAAGLPIVTLVPLRASARAADWIIGSAALPGITGKTANTIQLTKVAGAGVDAGAGIAQIRVHLQRPHSIGR
jgi:hypothetical protein